MIRSSSRSTTNVSYSGSATAVQTNTIGLKPPPPPQRTLSDVRAQVAHELAVRSVVKAKTIEGVKVGVVLSLSNNEDELFLRQVADKIKATMLLQQSYLFAIASEGTPGGLGGSSNTLVLCGSSDDYVQRAVLLASSKFMGRIESVFNEGNRWIATVRDIGTSSYDEKALWDVVKKSTRPPADPLKAPPGSKSIDRILSDARTRLARLTPVQAFEELHDPTVDMPVFLIDIRPFAQREREGSIIGSLVIESNVLLWRMDPRSESRLSIADRYDLRAIVFCSEGYTSSLSAASLHDLGLMNATDIVGGYSAWRAAGLPGEIKRHDDNTSVSQSQFSHYG